MKAKRHRLPPSQTKRVRALRRAASVPEQLLWSRLRAARLAGLKFRRQHAIGPFITDFCCPAARLVVELDGMTHVGRAAEDRQRTAYLESLGWRVARYTNDQVIVDVDAVAESIARLAGVGTDVAHPACDPPPAPPLKGGGRATHAAGC